MKKTALYIMVLSFAFGCNNESKEPVKAERTRVDSLQDEVNDGHIAGMAKMGKLTTYQQRASRLLDSLNKLPAKARTATADYKTRVESLLKDLDYADYAMNRWMTDYAGKDTAITEPAARLKFLEEEKQKVIKVKEAILTSISKADSLLKSQIQIPNSN